MGTDLLRREDVMAALKDAEGQFANANGVEGLDIALQVVRSLRHYVPDIDSRVIRAVKAVGDAPEGRATWGRRCEGVVDHVRLEEPNR